MSDKKVRELRRMLERVIDHDEGDGWSHGRACLARDILRKISGIIIS